VIAYESGVAAEPDPLGGSYFLEHLTRASEDRRGLHTAHRRDGGMIAAIENGFPQREIADASYRYQREVETGDKICRGCQWIPVASENPSRSSRSIRKPRTPVTKLAALRKSGPTR